MYLYYSFLWGNLLMLSEVNMDRIFHIDKHARKSLKCFIVSNLTRGTKCKPSSVSNSLLN